MSKRLQIFISYSNKDVAYREQLEIFLNPLKEMLNYITWNDGNIIAGQNWDDEIKNKLEKSKIVIFLVSQDFLASKYIQEVEINETFKRHDNGSTIVIPVIIRDCHWERDNRISKLSVLPRMKKPVQEWHFRDRAYKDITEGILQVIDKIIYDTKESIDFSRTILFKDDELQSNPNISINIEKTQSDLDTIRNIPNKNIKAFLKANSFDSETDLDGKITNDIFYSYLYVENNELLELYDTFKNLIHFGDHNRVIFLNGFAGTGKTTFIKGFANKFSYEYEHIYIDLSKVLINFPINSNDPNKTTSKEIIGMLAKYVRDKYDILQTFHFMINNCLKFFEENFISEEIYKVFNNREIDNINMGFVIECMSKFDFKDIFTCFFTHLFLNVDLEKDKVIYLDNMDAVSVEYIATVFFEIFDESLRNGNIISRSKLFRNKKINFTSKFKFVFCVRDGFADYINSRINVHEVGRLNYKRVPFKFILTSNLYRDIVNKRIDFIQKVFDNDELTKYKIKNNELKTWFEFLTNDPYFEKVFIPLFNNDYRSSVEVMIDVIVNLRDLGLTIDDFKNNTLNAYVARGILINVILTQLNSYNFIHDYPRYFDHSMDDEGYCSIDRMLLTVILNLGIRKKNQIYKDNQIRILDLKKIVDYMTQCYQEDEIIESIARLFLYHRKNWVHLITIIGLEVKNENTFNEEYNNCINKNDVKIRLNPSGFSYIRYILPHFEFYSILSGIKKPLFLYDLELIEQQKTLNTSFKYKFEEVINKTLLLVHTHILSMKKFYVNKLNKSYSLGKYKQSEFSFKFYGNENKKHREGYFHSTRIITYHIDYIDKFRIFLLRKIIREKQIDNKFKIYEINTIFVGIFQKYLELLETSIDDRASNDFVKPLKKRVEKISNDLFDIRTTLELDFYNK